jgi:hypothetical protein
LACPFFMPTQRCDQGMWPHPLRLPLGGGYAGCCTAPGHAGEQPSPAELADFCNLGYSRCSRLPQERAGDSIRFGVSLEKQDSVVLYYVLERHHAPVEWGTLEYNVALATWRIRHADAPMQRQAECFVESYLLRKNAPAVEDPQQELLALK